MIAPSTARRLRRRNGPPAPDLRRRPTWLTVTLIGLLVVAADGLVAVTLLFVSAATR